MSSALHEQPYLESWRWMSRQIRCAMAPDEPRLIDHYLAEGRYLACCTATSAWTIAETSFRLLLDTAADVALPWVDPGQGRGRPGQRRAQANQRVPGPGHCRCGPRPARGRLHAALSGGHLPDRLRHQFQHERQRSARHPGQPSARRAGEPQRSRQLRPEQQRHYPDHHLKIANDLRWMNSGALAGLGEIELEALQPGSSIMPGKVNPVIPEVTAMVAAQVIGNDTVITIAGQSGNFELNVMLPIIAENLLGSIELLANSSRLLGDKAIASFKVNEARIKEALSRNPILVTALNPIIGYQKAAEIAKKAYQQGRPVIDVALEHTDLTRSQLEELLNPEKLTAGGV